MRTISTQYRSGCMPPWLGPNRLFQRQAFPCGPLTMPCGPNPNHSHHGAISQSQNARRWLDDNSAQCQCTTKSRSRIFDVELPSLPDFATNAPVISRMHNARFPLAASKPGPTSHFVMHHPRIARTFLFSILVSTAHSRSSLAYARTHVHFHSLAREQHFARAKDF